MDRLQSIKECIDDHIGDSGNVKETKIWLEGWICGVTDDALTCNQDLRDEAMSYLSKVYNETSNSDSQ